MLWLFPEGLCFEVREHRVALRHAMLLLVWEYSTCGSIKPTISYCGCTVIASKLKVRLPMTFIGTPESVVGENCH